MNTKELVVAGGCFWCTESDLRKIKGVTDVISGYAGGDIANPTYEQVCNEDTGHREAIKIIYDEEVVSLRTLLLNYFDHIDPTDPDGQFHDRGFSYTTAVFYQNNEEKKVAEDLIEELDLSGIYDKKIATLVLPYKNFYPAEEYHQNYSEKSPVRYGMYRAASGREKQYARVCAIKEEKGLVNLFSHNA